MFYFLVRDYELTRNESTTVNAFFLVIDNFTATQATWKLSRFFVIPILTGQENKQSPIEPSKSRMINAFGKLKKKNRKKEHAIRWSSLEFLIYRSVLSALLYSQDKLCISFLTRAFNCPLSRTGRV